MLFHACLDTQSELVYIRHMNLAELGTILREARETHGMPKSVMARRVGISESHVAMVEAGQRRPSRPILEKWAQVLGWENDQAYMHQLLLVAGYIAEEPNPTDPSGQADTFPVPFAAA